jgi:hypothetical protein
MTVLASLSLAWFLVLCWIATSLIYAAVGWYAEQRIIP